MNIPGEGSIRLDGMELSSLSSYQRSRLISYMGHEPELMSDTLEENIRLGEPGDLDTVLQTVCFDREIAQMPEGVQTFAGSSGVRLSGGQQARTALARTLYHRRKLIILDDPFSAVDLTTEQKILSNIRQLAPDSILLLISHRLTLFPQFRQVIWMNEGTCTVSSHRELMHTNEMYAQLFRTQTASPVRQTTGGKHHEAQS